MDKVQGVSQGLRCVTTTFPCLFLSTATTFSKAPKQVDYEVENTQL